MKIGIILTGDYSWAGGVYYSLNIIKQLSAISVGKNLKIVAIINSSTPKDVLAEIPTVNTSIVNLDKKSLLYKFYHKYLGDRFLADFNRLKLDILYPFIKYEKRHEKLNCQVYYWLFDFQHKFLPEMFTRDEIYTRDGNFANISLYGKNIIFSSQNAKAHFHSYYRDSPAKLHVFQFVSLIQIPKEIKIDPKYPKKYFIVCNQFWQHKNHLAVLCATKILNDNKANVHVIFTGKYDSEFNKEYVNRLMTYVERNKLHKYITFTGFISREEQINLIYNSLAVIQPSLFEGWSTVIEDAKALNKFVIASDIEINREQINDNVMFFDPKNYTHLALVMAEAYSADKIDCHYHYNRNIEKSKNDLISIFNIK